MFVAAIREEPSIPNNDTIELEPVVPVSHMVVPDNNNLLDIAEFSDEEEEMPVGKWLLTHWSLGNVAVIL